MSKYPVPEGERPEEHYDEVWRMDPAHAHLAQLLHVILREAEEMADDNPMSLRCQSLKQNLDNFRETVELVGGKSGGRWRNIIDSWLEVFLEDHT